MNPYIALEEKYCAKNYLPLPVVLVRGEGVHVWDDAGNQYLDMMSAYSAVSHGHCHPELVKALSDQAGKLAIVSRAYHTDRLGAFLQKACELVQLPKALPMNTGAEGVETALKAVRKWGYKIKGIAENQAEIIVCRNNFHGRTIAIVGMSTEMQYRDGFGPFPAGFKVVPYGDVEAFRAAVNKNTAGFLVEPIQGEGGILIPPDGYLKACADICKANNVLMISDEIQTGLARTGKILACWHDDVHPDGVILGKALGGGLMPVSMFLATEELMSVFTPGDHGSTFGGNALSSTVGLKALEILERDNYCQHSAELGAYFLKQLQMISSPIIKAVRGRGLFIGVEVVPQIPARKICLRLMELGLLSKETHDTVIRFAPPLVITKDEIDHSVALVKQAVSEF